MLATSSRELPLDLNDVVLVFACNELFVPYLSVALQSILVNTSRGALVKTDDLIEGIRARKFFGAGLDVYEEETPNVFEDRSEQILESSVTARLLSFPNVIITSHQGFFTREALEAIAETTLENALAFQRGEKNSNTLGES